MSTRGIILTAVVNRSNGNSNGIAMGESNNPNLNAKTATAMYFIFFRTAANLSFFKVLSPRSPARQEKSFVTS